MVKVGEFKVKDVLYVVVRIEESCHTMTEMEYRQLCKIYGKSNVKSEYKQKLVT